MYTFPIEHIYLVDTIQNNKFAMERANRLMQALGASSPKIISAEKAMELRSERPAELPYKFRRRTGVFDYSKGWNVFLTAYHGGKGWGNSLAMSGYRDGTKQMGGTGVCRSALEIHCAYGCYHRCAYCFVDPHFLIACDLENLAEKIPEYCSRYPNQKLYKFDNWTDTIVLEPEYGASELFVPLFGELDDRYLLLYTKSDNVDHLLDLNHNGHTIINWSISALEQSKTIEINAPDTFARIEAMSKCEAAGYTVRARISPIVPLKGWRKGLTEMIDALFSAVTPDVVTIDVVGWSHPEALLEAMDTSLFEKPFQDELHELIKNETCKQDKYLFSHELRFSALQYTVAELKKRSPKTPVALCNETRRMWNDLGDILNMNADNYACCCGPDSVPGHPFLTKARQTKEKVQ